MLILIVCAIVASGIRAPGRGAERPNILLIITDQQFANALGAAGNPYLKTPAMDSLAARGIRFEKSYCTYPLCTPDRASLVTSRMPHELKVFENGKSIPKDALSMGEIFRNGGYQTAWAGKWHVPIPYPGFNKNRQKGGPRGFVVLPLEGPKHRSNPNVGPGIGSDPATVKAALKFLRQTHEQPFLLAVSLLKPHDICEYSRKPEIFPLPSPEDPLPPLPTNFNVTANEATGVQVARQARLASGPKLGHWGRREWQTYRWAYYRLTEIVDRHIATVLDALERSGKKDNTLILFTSDHGEMCGAHGLVTKMQMYEEAVKVPLIVCVPGESGHPTVDQDHLVSALDVLPTICDYARVPVLSSFEGQSLRPLIEGTSTSWRSHLVVEMGAECNTRMVRSSRYKYVVYATGKVTEMLFDLQADPGEMRNLAHEASLESVRESHRQMLREWIRKTDDCFTFPSGI